MKFKEGDRVIRKTNKDKFIILSGSVNILTGVNIFPVGGRYFYCLLPENQDDEFCLRMRVEWEEELELDKQWCREQKLKDMLA